MTKTASEHASVPTTFNRHIGWIRIPFVVLRLGFIVIYINKSAENVLVRFTTGNASTQRFLSDSISTGAIMQDHGP